MPSVDNLIATVIVVAILGGAIYYIIKAKKSGRKCIGCPDGGACSCSGSGSCSGSCSGEGTCSCGCDEA